MAKDVNIHVKAHDAEASKQKLDQVAQSAENVGNKVSEAGKKGATDTKLATSELSGMSKILGSLKTQVAGFVGAWLGLQGVQKVVGWLIQKLERVSQLQQDIYQNSLNLAQVGQALEVQTGTRGQQEFWAQQAVGLQQAGALADSQTAGQMLTSMDIAFAAQGGIKNPAVVALGKQISPFVGAMQFNAEQVARLFNFAKTAGVAPTPEAYNQFFAKIHTAYTTSKSTRPGEFLTGLQQSVTGYIAAGGSLEEGLSTYASALAVTPNEALAATLTEQVSRIAAGGYQRPREAMEGALGVKWSDMAMDQRKAALLQYVTSIPESQRAEILSAQGFPVELTSQLGKLVSPEAMTTLTGTRQAIGGAGAGQITDMTTAFLESNLAKQRRLEAGQLMRELGTGSAFASWQRRLQESEGRLRILSATGEDRLLVPDSAERYLMAYESMLKDLGAIEPYITDEKQREKLVDIQRGLKAHMFRIQEDPIAARFYGAGYGARVGHRLSQEMAGIAGDAAVNYNFNNNTNYYPKIGADERGPRFSQDE